MAKSNGGTRQSTPQAPRGFSYSQEYQNLQKIMQEYRQEGQWRAEDKARDKLLKLGAKEEREFYGVDEAIRIIRKNGVTLVRKSTTRIRGYYNFSSGYSLNDYHPRDISIDTTRSAFERIIKDFNDNGFEYELSNIHKGKYSASADIKQIRKKK